jgi:type VI protein secretion system component VasF
MTHYIGTIYFLGKYRPLSVEGDNLEEVIIELSERAREAPQEVRERIKDLWLGIDTRNAAHSVQYGSYGAAWMKADKPPFPPDTWDWMEPCPNLIYN